MNIEADEQLLLYFEKALFSNTHELNLNLIWVARFIFLAKLTLNLHPID